MQNVIYLILFLVIDVALYLTFSTRSIVEKKSSKVIIALLILLFIVLHKKSIGIEFLMHAKKFSVLATSLLMLSIANFATRRVNSILYNPALNQKFIKMFKNIILTMPYIFTYIFQIQIIFYL